MGLRNGSLFLSLAPPSCTLVFGLLAWGLEVVPAVGITLLASGRVWPLTPSPLHWREGALRGHW